ncbi:Uncharacterised protein [Providencia stuartii]|nr:Uncharacterised protein [Providencia stuartii]
MSFDKLLGYLLSNFLNKTLFNEGASSSTFLSALFFSALKYCSAN